MNAGLDITQPELVCAAAPACCMFASSMQIQIPESAANTAVRIARTVLGFWDEQSASVNAKSMSIVADPAVRDAAMNENLGG